MRRRADKLVISPGRLSGIYRFAWSMGLNRARVWTLALIAYLGLCAGLRMSDAGLWDPWETHYGEVARNILTREDPMDLRWKPGYGPDAKAENLFRSKHVLPFWGMALGMSIADVGTNDEIDEMVRTPALHWALRLPSMLLAGVALAYLGLAVRAVAGWRAGLATALVLATMPQFVLLARQATTDIYFLAPYCMALAAWIFGCYAADKKLRQYEFRWKRWTLRLPLDLRHFIFTIFYVLAVAAPIFVLWQHVTSERMIRIVGKWPKRETLPTVADLASIADAMKVYGALAFAGWIWCMRALGRRELARYSLYLSAGWALMGKGLLGPGVIGLVIALDLFVRASWKDLRDAKLIVGTVLFVVAAAPWHHAMAIFRGEGWVNELLIVNNLARFVAGEQPQAVGDLSYYLGVFASTMGPWVLAIPVVITYIRNALTDFVDARSDDALSPAALLRFAVLSSFASFLIISVSVTKYIHYAALCLPTLAVIFGLWLGSAWESSLETPETSKKRDVLHPGFQIGLLALILWAVERWIAAEPAIYAHMTTYLYTAEWRQGAASVEVYQVLLGICAAGLAMYVLAKSKWLSRTWGRAALMFWIALSLLTPAFLFLYYVPVTSENWSQETAIRMYYDRRAPKDEIGSWWYYHRGETFYTKRKIWMLMRPDASKLRAFIDKKRKRGGDIWIVTSPKNLDRLRTHLPDDLADAAVVEYENFHEVLLRVVIP